MDRGNACPAMLSEMRERICEINRQESWYETCP